MGGVGRFGVLNTSLINLGGIALVAECSIMYSVCEDTLSVLKTQRLRFTFYALYVVLLVCLAGCGLERQTRTEMGHQVPSLMPTLAQPAEPTAGAGPADGACQSGAAGVELCQRSVRPRPGAAPAQVLIVRMNPAAVRLRVAYAPDTPALLSAWFHQSKPLLALNGGFFDPHYRSTALLISDGVSHGQSYTGFGGMLSVASDGQVALRSLRDQPYDSAESLQQALQSFPMLIFPGGQVAPLEDDGARARRSVIAFDRSGRLLAIVCPTSSFTLRGLADWLAQSDLEIERALNLDGGASTGLFLSAGSARVQIDSFDRLPIVLLVESAR